MHLFNLTQFERIVYLDADALVLVNVDDLFERNVSFAAAPDVFPPDRFNAGVMIVQPDDTVYNRMLESVATLPSYDTGDTGFLNAFFPSWFASEEAARLPFQYNAQRTMHWLTYAKQPGYWDAIQPVKILHFSSSPKPWDAPEKKGPLEMIWWNYLLESQMCRLASS